VSVTYSLSAVRRPGDKPLVFGIGFHKTGTSSLGKALELMGYRVRGVTGNKDPDIADKLYDLAWSTIDAGRYDAFQDNPWPIIFREIDARYPGSKFVLTVRDPDKWLASQVRHFGTATTPMRELIYGSGHGCPIGNEAIYEARYERHNAEVREYFAGRPEDMVEMHFERGDGWAELCPLLGANTPSQAFPHANAAADREAGDRGLSGVYKRLRQRLRG